MGFMEEKERASGSDSRGPFMVIVDKGQLHRLSCPSCNTLFWYSTKQKRAFCQTCGYKAAVIKKDE